MEQPALFTVKHLFGPEWLRSLVNAGILLGLAFIVEHFAVVYAFEYVARPTTTHVGDLFLDNLPIVDLNFIIIEIALLAIVVGTAFVVFFRPRYILFTLKSLALFIAIRALFMSLTHVGIHPGNIAPGSGVFDSVYSYFNFQTGLFFSGHTGMPFLMALIFWRTPRTRNIFLLLSFIFAIAVLLAHIHYSIDVLAAPFIAYGIFKIAHYLFLRDYKLIEAGHV
ncbi:MAG: phosphatase PAP2-related protein [Candidatus Paceibacterota bacterium]|jgi:hypothetical protein